MDERQRLEAELELLELEEAEEQERLAAASQVPLSDTDRKKGEVQKILSDVTSPENRKNISGAFNNAATVMTGGAVPGLQKLTANIAGKLGTAARLGTSGVVTDGAIGAAAAGPDDRLKGFLMGAGPSAALRLGGAALNKVGDIGMQVGVGRKKYTPGVGTELADEGIWGTKQMMKDQVESGLERNYDTMYRQASDIPEIDVRAIGNEIRDEMASPLNGHGRLQIRDRDREALETINSFADDIAQHGTESGTQALARRRAAGASGFNPRSDVPKTSLMGQLSKLEQKKYSEALKAADPTGALAKADKSYGALKRAQKSLNEEASLSGLGLVSRPVQALGGIGEVGATSLGQATAKGGKLAEWLAPLSKYGATALSDGGRLDSKKKKKDDK